ncbi:MAG: efflux RND transporter periplasmic adaptor subunit [Microscillaceae bacterium]|nr:efflux RND transporter periplasmic adaptor subunit [Microscillaceae bacterium]
MKAIHPCKYVFILLSFWACSQKPSSEEAQNTSETPKTDAVILTQEQIKASGIELGKSENRNIGLKIRANGIVDVPPSHEAQLHAKSPGFVKKVQVLPGDFVGEGQSLVLLENSTYVLLQEKYMTVNSEIQYLEQELKRQKTLQEDHINAQKTYQKIQSDYQIKVTEKASLARQLEFIGYNPAQITAQSLSNYFTVRAPISGYIKEVNAKIGQYLSTGDPMVSIVSNEHKHLELQVFEKDILKVQKGQKVLFQVPSLESETFEGTVFLVGKSFNRQTKSVNVHVHIDDPKTEEKLIPGMFVNAQILTDRRAAQLLPEDALVTEGAQNYIFIRDKAQNDQIAFRKIPIEVLDQGKEGIVFQTLSQLDKDAVFVRKGAFYLQADLRKSSEEE